MNEPEKPASDSSLRQLFREAYFKFMDDCEKLWQQHCQGLSDLSSNATRRGAELASKGDELQNATSLAEQATQEYQTHCESIRSNLQTLFKDYARGTARAWERAAHEEIDQVTLYHIGIANMNVAWNYGALSSRCTS